MRPGIAIGLLWLLACAPPTPPETGGSLTVGDGMSSGSTEGFERAAAPREFVFPEDHGMHPSYRTEWWYFTGNLDDAEGHSIGFQWTLFRHALAPGRTTRSTAWAGQDVWFAHFGLGDARRGEFSAFERFERGALGLAGVRAEPFEAWIGDWRVGSVGESTFPMRLFVAEGDIELDLVLDPIKPLVLQGDRGFSRKGPEPGNASFYYSATRIDAAGSVTIGGTRHEVAGQAWLDREWSTSALSEGQSGWDWFSIQLDDGRDLMFYRLRRSDGSTDPFDSGTVVEVDGTSHRLGSGDVRYIPGRVWESSKSGASYPVTWKLEIDSLGISLSVEPMLEASELDTAVRYWEGAIRVRGRDPNGPVTGRGFLEMTGYDGGAGDAGSPGSR